MVSHADEQVTLRFIALRTRYPIGLGELVQEIAALHCLFQKISLTPHSEIVTLSSYSEQQHSQS